jgi:hypothetical protein
MSNTERKPKPALGFLTILNNPQHGFFGGYLILNMSGIPLEFHCTMPIKPNRAQEILYGPMLESFLYGEQIGQTLLRQTNRDPLVVCTDCEPALTVRQYISRPVVLVIPPEQSVAVESEHKFFRIDRPHGGGPNLLTFELGRNRLALPARAEDQRQTVQQLLGELIDSFDLCEPFQRIRDAIEEAQQSVT